MLEYQGFDIHGSLLDRHRIITFIKVACRIDPRKQANQDIHRGFRKVIFRLPRISQPDNRFPQSREGNLINPSREAQTGNKTVGRNLQLSLSSFLIFISHSHGIKSRASAGMPPLIKTSSDLIAYPRPLASSRW